MPSDELEVTALGTEPVSGCLVGIPGRQRVCGRFDVELHHLVVSHAAETVAAFGSFHITMVRHPRAGDRDAVHLFDALKRVYQRSTSVPANLVQVVWTPASGLPEDVYVNTFHFNTAVAKDEDVAGDIVDNLQALYNTFETYLSSSISGVGVVKFYDLTDAQPRTPWATLAISTEPGAGQRLPDEVAVCLSYRAVFVSGSPNARRRGRVFIGPLNVNALSAANNGDLVSGTLVTLMASAAVALKTASDATADWSWVVWSTVDNAAREVLEGWIDNAFDTQRRRGRAPTSRVIWSL